MSFQHCGYSFMASIKRFFKRFVDCDEDLKECECNRCHSPDLRRERNSTANMCYECEAVRRQEKMEREVALKEAFGYY
jgi:hypothetical protein